MRRTNGEPYTPRRSGNMDRPNQSGVQWDREMAADEAAFRADPGNELVELEMTLRQAGSILHVLDHYMRENVAARLLKEVGGDIGDYNAALAELRTAVERKGGRLGG